ncbi:MAG: hypothetical protein E7K09_23115, partial [Klebsiella pneumoniae]|nr:hypothetical protein [Klebsiella pneumoniae]MDU7705061.1 hypothetical protein [Klebsiella pneumoniae]
MSTYKTKNPLGSAAVKDLYDNAENVDKFVNDRTKEELEDRLGVLRKTWHGMEMIFSRFIDYITGRGEQAVAAIGWQELGNWAVGLAVDNRQQIVYYNGSWYKYLGELEHVIAGDSPENDGGVWSAANPTGKWSNIGDAALRSNLGSNELPGTGIVSLKYSGTVADALVDIYVDALGDFKNMQDGCTEAILAAVAHWGGRTDSAYVQGQKKYGRIHFPNGTYALEDLPFIAGWDYELEPFTLIVPHRNAKFAFTTVGTKGVVPGDPTWQRLMYSQISGGVIGDYWKETGNVPVGAGGINLLNGSYVRLRNIAIRHIRGIAIYGGELFDSPFENVSVMYCGNADPNNYAPCVLFDNAGGHDATNACKFDRLHLEANHTGGIWNKCRHMIFNSMKVERDEGTHVLAGCLGMTFMAPGLTFNRNDIPQFLIKDFAKDDTTEQAASDSRGVIFESPSCISSSAGNGWYFQHTGNAGPLVISNLFGNGTGLLFKGKRAARTVLTGMCYSVGSATRQGSSSLTRFIGQ